MGKKIGFEDSVEKLNGILATLEAGSVGLDEALRLFEEGVALVRKCSDELEKAEQKVKLLTETSDGTMTEQDFSAERNEN